MVQEAREVDEEEAPAGMAAATAAVVVMVVVMAVVVMVVVMVVVVAFCLRTLICVSSVMAMCAGWS